MFTIMCHICAKRISDSNFNEAVIDKISNFQEIAPYFTYSQKSLFLKLNWNFLDQVLLPYTDTPFSYAVVIMLMDEQFEPSIWFHDVKQFYFKSFTNGTEAIHLSFALYSDRYFWFSNLWISEYATRLRSFGHQGALYYIFLASDPLKTSREYAVFTLRTRGPKVCTRETSRQTQRVSAFFVLIAPNDRITSHIAGHWWPGQNFMMFQRTKNERFRMVTSKILCKRQKWGRSRPICLHIFAL